MGFSHDGWVDVAHGACRNVEAEDNLQRAYKQPMTAVGVCPVILFWLACHLRSTTLTASLSSDKIIDKAVAELETKAKKAIHTSELQLMTQKAVTCLCRISNCHLTKNLLHASVKFFYMFDWSLFSRFEPGLSICHSPQASPRVV